MSNLTDGDGWQKEWPTEPGWYRCKDDDRTFPAVVFAVRPGSLVYRDGDHTLYPNVDGPYLWQRIPDPVPCPITQPVTLTKFSSGYIGIKGMADSSPGQIALTLLPAGTYTWEGRVA